MVDWLVSHGLPRDRAEELADALAALGVTARGFVRLAALLQDKKRGGDDARRL